MRPTSLSPLVLLVSTVLLAASVAVAARPVDAAAPVVNRRAPAPQPSRRMGVSKRKTAAGKAARAAAALGDSVVGQQQVVVVPTAPKDFSSFLCPDASTACPVPAVGSSRAAVTARELEDISAWFLTGFECIDPAEELGSCGGCLSLGQGCVLLPLLDSPPLVCAPLTCSWTLLPPARPVPGKTAR